MTNYMVTYYYSYTEEGLRNPDTRGMSFHFTTQSSYQDAHDATMIYIRQQYGSNIKALIVSITDQTATEYLAQTINPS